MAEVARLLETMHPMREPPAPEAILPILFGLASGCLLAVAILLIAQQMRHRRTALRTAAEAALAASRRLAPGERLAAQALLLRRLVRSLAGDEAARAQGPSWLSRLDETFATRFFTQGEGAAFGADLYRQPEGRDIEAIDRTLAGLIAQLRPARFRTKAPAR